MIVLGCCDSWNFCKNEQTFFYILLEYWSIVKICIIDDDKETTSMLSKFFEFKGFEVFVTNDPTEGVIKIRREHFDAIILDIGMPVISGLGVIELLAGADILKTQNIFILSGKALPPIQLKNLLRRDGIKAFLEKPSGPDEIFAAMTS